MDTNLPGSQGWGGNMRVEGEGRMCDCRSSIEARLLARAKELHPQAADHKVKLTGYVFLFGETVTVKGAMPFEFSAEFPLKKGGTKRKTEKSSMIFTYCPFCGVKYDAEAPHE